MNSVATTMNDAAVLANRHSLGVEVLKKFSTQTKTLVQMEFGQSFRRLYHSKEWTQRIRQAHSMRQLPKRSIFRMSCYLQSQSRESHK